MESNNHNEPVIGVVAIGRNEGERLRGCLESLVNNVTLVVYVDSGSTDNSIEMARGYGVHVVELDLTQPFTAARARNAGLDQLLEIQPDVEFVQFVDGDCEVFEGWVEAAMTSLQQNEKAAAVCGRVRERNPGQTIYNRLCDIEWNFPATGETKACGGNAMMRVKALRDVGGYNSSLIAGEEPELCIRLRSAGWSIHRLDADMVWHDAAMSRFGQWWKRTTRAGYSYAEGVAMHGAPPEEHYTRETRSGLFWGLALPVGALVLAWPTKGLSLVVLLLGYVVLFAKIFVAMKGQIENPRHTLAYSFFIVLAKFPEVVGQIQYRLATRLGRRRGLIEYK